VNRIWILLLLLLGGSTLLLSVRYFQFAASSPSPEPTASLANSRSGGGSQSEQPTAKKADLQYKVMTLPQSTVHVLVVPAGSEFVVVPAVAQSVGTVEQFAQQSRAIAAINAGFFDPQNQKSTSYVTVRGRQIADPKLNERLVNNPDLAPYLPKIFNRSEFRHYRCEETTRYDIALHADPPLKDCELVVAIGGGPQLLPQYTARQEGFVDEANGVVIRDSLGSQQRNARSAIGIDAQGNLVLVMVAQNPTDPTNSGMSLPELADFLKKLKVEKALNLDGGSSAAFYYQGKNFLGKVDEAGNSVQRPVKSVLLVTRGQYGAK
jgi:hypothetical protein